MTEKKVHILLVEDDIFLSGIYQKKFEMGGQAYHFSEITPKIADWNRQNCTTFVNPIDYSQKL